MQVFKQMALMVLISCLSTQVHAADKAQVKAIEDYFEAIKLPDTYITGFRQEMEVKIKQNATFAPHSDFILQVYEKYLGWDALKPHLIKVFAANFTAKEMKEIAKFYKTSAGQKALRHLPIAMQQIEVITQELMNKHAKDFTDDVQAYLNKPKPKDSVSTFQATLKKGEKLMQELTCFEDDCPRYIESLKMADGIEVLVAFVEKPDGAFEIRSLINGQSQKLSDCLWGDGDWAISVHKIDEHQLVVACSESPFSSDPGFAQIKLLELDKDNKLKEIKDYFDERDNPTEPIPKWSKLKKCSYTEKCFWKVQ